MIHPRAVRLFNEKVTKGRTSCWLWQGGRDADGYGRVTIANRQYKAHRVAYAIAKNIDLSDVPKELGHTCGKRLCVNPAHLSTQRAIYNKGGYR